MRRDGGIGLMVGGGALALGVLVLGISLGTAMAGGSPAEVEYAGSSHGEDAGTAANGSTVGDAGGALTLRSTDAGASAAAGAPSSPVSPDVLRLAVDRAPFAEDRTPPARRYTLPGDEPPPPPVRAELPPPPEFRLLGAASSGTGGWAVIQVGDEGPRMVAAGESVSGYTLTAIHPEAVVMAGMGQSVQVPLAGPAATIEAPAPTGRNVRGRNQPQGGGQPQAAAGAPPLQQVQAALREAMASGTMPDAGAILGSLQGLGGLGGAQVTTDGNRITVTTPGGQQTTIDAPGGGAVRMFRLQGAPGAPGGGQGGE